MLGVLMMIQRNLSKRGGQLIVSDVAPEIYEVFDVTRLTKLMEVRQQKPPDAASPT
jgi:anti-anti-sigma regulatory factor